jgi:hypothetical protein
MRKKYAQERSGWRSLVEAAYEIGLSPSAMYGKSGGKSPFVNELIRQGFVEVASFPGSAGAEEKYRSSESPTRKNPSRPWSTSSFGATLMAKSNCGPWTG